MDEQEAYANVDYNATLAWLTTTSQYFYDAGNSTATLYVGVGIIIVWIAFSWHQQRQREIEARKQQEEYAALVKKMTIEPRDNWTLDQIKVYNGNDPNAPILFAARGTIYNVWRGREFYGKGSPYHIFAGTDATRLLAKGLLEPESEEDRAQPLGWFEKDSLNDWISTFEMKYDDVGKLKGWDPKDCGL